MQGFIVTLSVYASLNSNKYLRRQPGGVNQKPEGEMNLGINQN